MRLKIYLRELARRARLLAGVYGIVCAGLLVVAAAAPDQPAGDTVGLIEGQDIRVTGPMSVEVVAGQTKTILRSGSDVQVKSGQARISLVEGGQISVCGPAHFSVLKSGGALTVALESGAIHARVDREPALTVYTAEIQAQTMAIGDDPRDVLMGFPSPGMMCIHTYRGALRVEQQLSGRSVIVPQGVDVMLANGQIDEMRNGAGQCKCELQIAKIPAAPAGGSDAAASSSEEAADEKPEAREEPIYTVIMPPLEFDAKAKVQPEPDMRLMTIVRRVRVRPALVFQGRVEEEATATAVATKAPPKPPAASAAAKKTTPAEGSVVDRMRSFFRKLWSRGG
ncbi:MAG TPA: hypothetical protein VN087_11545 [Verrucomicrobiae bacterium]|nr:hypothetical protein [Verrucomicrobiae bacterium]